MPVGAAGARAAVLRSHRKASVGQRADHRADHRAAAPAAADQELGEVVVLPSEPPFPPAPKGTPLVSDSGDTAQFVDPHCSSPPAGAAALAASPTPVGWEGAERRIMLCLDEHDDRADAAVSYVSYLVLPSQVDGAHRSQNIQNRVCIFAHVHLDSKVPFAGALSRLFGGEGQSRTDRSARMRDHCHAVAGAMAQHIAPLARNVEVSVQVDDSNMSQVQAYPAYARAFQPHYVVLNERADRDGSVFNGLLGTESWRVLHSLDAFTIIVAKTNVEGLPREGDEGPRAGEKKSVPPRCLQPERGRGMHVLLMVDPELNEASRRAVACAVDLLKPEDRVLLYSSWTMPDFATAMYANEARWRGVLRRAELHCRQRAHAVAQHVVQHTGMPAQNVRVYVEQERCCETAAKLLSKGTFHLVICGGKRWDDESAKGPVFRGWVGHYRRRAFGTTADYMISHTGAPAVAVCY